MWPSSKLLLCVAEDIMLVANTEARFKFTTAVTKHGQQVLRGQSTSVCFVSCVQYTSHLTTCITNSQRLYANLLQGTESL